MPIAKKITNYEKAHEDYKVGMKYKDIAIKYGVSENTVKTWRKRYNWEPRNPERLRRSIQGLGNKHFNAIRVSLLTQLEQKGTIGEHFTDLVDTYMELFNIKNNLIKDIKERGVAVELNNEKQLGIKKNDSITELNKTIAQMLSILNDSVLKPSSIGSGGFGGGEDDL